MFHEGILRIDTDEHRPGGSHVHVWVPAAIVPMAMHFVPRRHINHAVAEISPWLPTVRVLTKEFKKYPEADLVQVDSARDHVHIQMHGGRLLIDVDEPGQTVHVACPLAMLQDVADQLEASVPDA
jgi:hypothetical protein